MLSNDSFIKWLAIKAFNINEISNTTKIGTIFIFMKF